MFAFTIVEMGLNPFLALTWSIAFFFVVALALTSRNIDLKGLLRVLYSKPLRMEDGTVEYRKVKWMEFSNELIGNPITLLIERALYLILGCFFVFAFYKGVRRSSNEKDL